MAASFSSESGVETDLEVDKKHDELYINAIVPQKVPYDSKAQIIIVFNKALPKSKTYNVEFVGESRAPMHVQATRLNEYTLTVQAPVYFPPECVEARVCYGIQRKPLGSCYFTFESRAEILANLLYDSSDPVTFMCEALNISPQDLETLDSTLASIFMNNIPHGFNILGVYREKVETVTCTYARYPTLLHFGAAHDLRNLVDSLLTCPGAAEATLLKNCHEMKPKDLAEYYQYDDIKEKLLTFEAKIERAPYVDMESQQAYEIMGHEAEGVDSYVSVDQTGDESNYMDMTAGDEDGSGYVRTDGQDQSGEAGYLVMSGREEVEDHYQDVSRNGDSNTGDIYEEMDQNNEPTDVYEPVEGHSPEAPPVPARGSSAIYDRPCNLPLSDYPLHRSASTSENPREAVMRRPVTKHKFAPAAQQDDLSKDSILVQSIMEKVRVGHFTQEEANQYLSRLGIPTPSTSVRDSTLIIRSGSTSSRISNTSTASSVSSSSHGSVPETSGYGGDKEDNDDNLMSLADLRKSLESKKRQQKDKQVPEKPPLPPPADYESEVKRQERPPEPPINTRRVPKTRNKTAPVNPVDVERARAPPPLQRRGTAPPTNPKPGQPSIPKIQLAFQDRRPSLPLEEPQNTDGRYHEKSLARPPQPPPANQRPAAPPPPVENRNTAAPPSPGPQKSSAPNLRGGMPTPFAVALKQPMFPPRKTDTDETPPRLSRPGQRPPLAPPRPQQRH